MNITLKEAITIRKESHTFEAFFTSLKTLISSKLVEKNINESLVLFNPAVLTSSAENVHRVARYTFEKFVRKRRPYDEERTVLKLEDIAEYSPLDNIVEEPIAEGPTPKKYRKSINEVGKTIRGIRLKEIIAVITDNARENGVSDLDYLGMIIKHMTYPTSNRKLGQVVAGLLSNSNSDIGLSKDTASHIQQQCQLGRTSNQGLRLVLKETLTIPPDVIYSRYHTDM